MRAGSFIIASMLCVEGRPMRQEDLCGICGAIASSINRPPAVMMYPYSGSMYAGPSMDLTNSGNATGLSGARACSSSIRGGWLCNARFVQEHLFTIRAYLSLILFINRLHFSLRTSRIEPERLRRVDGRLPIWIVWL